MKQQEVEQREKFKILAQIRKNVASKKWTCIEPGCNRIAIHSHLLQRNGVLTNIADNGHLYELKGTDIHRWYMKSQPFEFKKIGISKALALPLFCGACDSTLFEPIEKQQIDLCCYQAFVLLNYRVACAEQRKKQIEIEVFQRTLNSRTLMGKLDTDAIEEFVYGFQLGVKDLDKLKDLIKNEIKSPKEIFHFSEFSYPLIKVYGAALFGTTDEDTINEPERVQFDDVFIHVIPLKSRLSIMCGYLNEYKTDWTTDFGNSWRNLNDSDLKIKLTNLFAARIENWGIAPSLFESIPRVTINKMVEFWDKNAMSLHKELKPDFNFFG